MNIRDELNDGGWTFSTNRLTIKLTGFATTVTVFFSISDNRFIFRGIRFPKKIHVHTSVFRGPLRNFWFRLLN